MSKANWNKIANWYDSMIGEKGSKFHINNAIPILLDQLYLQKRQIILDVGSGNGFLSKYIYDKGCKYIGVDISNRFIAIAKKKFGKYGKFINADISSNRVFDKISRNSIDKAVLLLCVQDIKDLADCIKNVSRLVKARGELLIFMLHPCFRVPRQSGYGYDKNRKLIYRRIDSYLTNNNVPYRIDKNKKQVLTYFYHRPLQFYLNALFKNNFIIKEIKEIPSFKSEDNKRPKNERRIEKEIPLFLSILASKSDLK